MKTAEEILKESYGEIFDAQDYNKSALKHTYEQVALLAMKSFASQSPRWVIASDNLPQAGITKPLKIDGVRYEKGHWSESDNAFMVYERNNLVRYPPTLFLIEWLEELPPPPETEKK